MECGPKMATNFASSHCSLSAAAVSTDQRLFFVIHKCRVNNFIILCGFLSYLIDAMNVIDY